MVQKSLKYRIQLFRNILLNIKFCFVYAVNARKKPMQFNLLLLAELK